jgi:hypothetical protein
MPKKLRQNEETGGDPADDSAVEERKRKAQSQFHTAEALRHWYSQSMILLQPQV